MKGEILVPQLGAWVVPASSDTKRRGVVQGVEVNGHGPEVKVLWLGENSMQTLPLSQLRCGFMLGMEVQDVPRSFTRAPLGEGIVVELRRLGHRDQVLVEFPDRGERHWLPWQNLRQIRGIRERFERGQTGEPGNAERMRLRLLAHAIETWNENTGSFSHLHIDPLPHQIHLVHHILASGNLNWLIADDVGLGKTIEVGMLLSALKARGTFRRILLVTPAGLVKQWKDELHYKFDMSDFMIYGRDFFVHEARNWKLYDHVIGSMDLFKTDNHLENLVQAGTWDLIVFDEAHRLGRTQYGRSFDSSDRFRLAARLREKTDAMVLLTATPHQGRQDRFQALLELIRPHMKADIQRLALNPEIIKQMVIRNHKADATDVDGNFIFKGKITKIIDVPLDEAEKEFDRSLQRYLREGYQAGKERGVKGQAVGFVMTTYRKLAASSLAAIQTALTKRLIRIEDRNENDDTLESEEETDERYIGEWEEQHAGTRDEFFVGESSLVRALLNQTQQLLKTDAKIRVFLDELVSQVLEANPEEKIVIFAEYRSSQDYVAQALRTRFGEASVSLIHGSMSQTERAESIAHFEDRGQFLVSTEAGGEGINLHSRCHTMINFDLPWNPMRLVQRVGRLYRYGQEKVVVVFNVHSSQTIDANIVQTMYQRITQVVSDMSPLGGEYRPGLEADILGDLAEVLDVGEVLAEAATAPAQVTQARMDEALKQAREAVKKQNEMFEHATAYNPDEEAGGLRLTNRHVRSFVEGALAELQAEVQFSHGGRVLNVKLPDEMRKSLGIRRERMSMTLDRSFAAKRPDVELLDADAPIFQYLVAFARSFEFDGRVAGVQGLDGEVLIGAMLRWQNDQGRRMRREFTTVLLQPGGRTSANDAKVATWMLQPAMDGGRQMSKDEAKAYLRRAEGALDNRLGAVSNADLHPGNRAFVAVAGVAR